MATWVVDAKRSSQSPGRKPVKDDEREDRRLAVGLHAAAVLSVVAAAVAAAAAATAILFWSELRAPPRWNALRRSVDATIPAIVSDDLTWSHACKTTFNMNDLLYKKISCLQRNHATLRIMWDDSKNTGGAGQCCPTNMRCLLNFLSVFSSLTLSNFKRTCTVVQGSKPIKFCHYFIKYWPLWKIISPKYWARNLH